MKARVIAYYLPQFHPIPENDEWWGKGFTEWFNVAKSTPLFKGHYQPKIPTELGFYDLRLPLVREQQAALAKDAGIEGFMYWHYWFGEGKQLLEKPFQEVVTSGTPDFPFCLGWANHTWSSRTWNKDRTINVPNILMEQKYPGIEDYVQHFYSVLPAFKDHRYITVDGKPFFLIWNPLAFKDVKSFIDCWRELAIKNGLKGIHFVGIASSLTYRASDSNKYDLFHIASIKENYQKVLDLGFDAVNSNGMPRANLKAKGKLKTYIDGFLKKVLHISFVSKLDQSKVNKYLFAEEDKWENVYPTIIPNFDRTPRTNSDTVYINSTPEVFEECASNCFSMISGKHDEHKIVMLKSWNEWGEGNYMEPDIKYGRGYINALRRALSK